MTALAGVVAALGRCAVFDLDGTLVDTAPTLGWALNAALADARLPELDEERVRGCVGHGFDRFVRSGLALAAGPVDAEVEAGVRAAFYRRMAAEPCRGAAPRDGALGILTELQNAGVAVGVCTNKATSAADAVLEGLGLRAWVDELVGAEDWLRPKPAPDPLLLCLRRLRATAGQTVVIGDSAVDAAMARAAGCALVLVRGGYELAPIDELGADLVIDELTDLIGLNTRTTSTPTKSRAASYRRQDETLVD